MSLYLAGERLVLRSMTREDLTLTLEIYNSNPDYNLLRNGDDSVTLAEVEAEYDATLTIPTGYWLALCVADRLIGVMHLIVSNPSDQKSWISMLLLHSDYQRQGFGKEAVSLVEQHCLKAGSRNIHHGVIAHNAQALLFWGMLGYEQYRHVQAPVGRLTQPVLLVAKWLDEAS
ncbi:GNAT family N-acetyltransferase [Brevibacillus reuszeri]|uniref:GNAT family N-acetyltransferase n=1 Tax=Brevibacillus reuszeri TaxID=54915 RepID=UPI00289DAEBB|nr:GNAT family N-acetyltransferase [Brevibacillus reuszeri]